MSHNIKAQMIRAINESTDYGASKHSATGGQSGAVKDHKIYSVAYHGDLCKTAKSFGGWLQQEHPEIRQVRDIRPDLIEGYLQSRSVNRESAVKILSHITKIGKVCDHQYGKCRWETSAVQLSADLDTQKLRTVSASEDSYNKIVTAMQTGRSNAWKAVVLSRHAGLRVNEAVHVRLSAVSYTGGRYGYGTIVLTGREDGCKGGRARTVDILSPEARDAIMGVCRGVKDGDRIVTTGRGEAMQPDSISRAISRAVGRAGLDAEQWKHNGNHAFRKAFAVDCFRVAKQGGASDRDAFGYANKQLGHGENRDDLTKIYLAGIM